MVLHEQRSWGDTWPKTCSTCCPQPFHDGRPHCLQVTSVHTLNLPSVRQSQADPHRCSLRMILSILKLIAMNRTN